VIVAGTVFAAISADGHAAKFNAVDNRPRFGLSLDDFDSYLDVFGRHASDSCLRRVGQAIRRCLRRASDVVARPDGQRFVVLSHATDEEGVRDFARKISTAVRELGLHHPRSSSSRFVTVSYDVSVANVTSEQREAREFLKDLLSTESQ
jgi:diguanylate cyclase (GGDEF)-like protein